MKQGKESTVKDGFATGKNLASESDPGLADAAALNFRLKPDSRVFKDLPAFQPIPMEQIGLKTDEYRKVLSTPAEMDRLGTHTVHAGPVYDVEDR